MFSGSSYFFELQCALIYCSCLLPFSGAAFRVRSRKRSPDSPNYFLSGCLKSIVSLNKLWTWNLERQYRYSDRYYRKTCTLRYWICGNLQNFGERTFSDVNIRDSVSTTRCFYPSSIHIQICCNFLLGSTGGILPGEITDNSSFKLGLNFTFT